jgi:hypothetical protein
VTSLNHPTISNKNDLSYTLVLLKLPLPTALPFHILIAHFACGGTWPVVLVTRDSAKQHTHTHIMPDRNATTVQKGSARTTKTIVSSEAALPHFDDKNLSSRRGQHTLMFGIFGAITMRRMPSTARKRRRSTRRGFFLTWCCILVRIFLLEEEKEGISGWSPIAVTPTIQLRPAPLIGGPSWLPLHCQVIVDTTHVFDFVPLNATSPATLQKLLALQAVPATARIRQQRQQQQQQLQQQPIDCNTAKVTSRKNNNKKTISDDPSQTVVVVTRAMAFCQDYDKDLHLLHNNCWTFAYDLISYALREEKRHNENDDGDDDDTTLL